MFKIGPSLALGLALAGLTSTAQAATLADVLDAAWSADSQWNAALRTWEANQELQNQGRAALLPDVNFTYDWMNNDLKSHDNGSRLDYDSQAFTVQLVQPLFNGQAWYGYKQLQAVTSVAAANFEQERQDFFLRVAEQYFQVLRSSEDLTTLQAQERALGRQLEQTRERFEVGLVARTEVLEAQSAHDLTRADLILAQAQFDIARDRLEALTGRSWDSLATLREELPLNGPEPAQPEQWVELARERNPSLLMALYNSEASRQNAAVKTWAHAPTVSLVGQWQHTRTDPDSNAGLPYSSLSGNNMEGHAVGVQVKVPLFAGGSINSQRKQANLEYEASQESYQQTWRDVGQATLARYRVVSANALRIQARVQAIRSAESALEATQAGYDVGTRNIVDVLNATLALYSARREYAATRFDYISESLNLKALAGVLSEEDLKQVNQWLDDGNQLLLDEVGQIDVR